jgi:hypothetical protein
MFRRIVTMLVISGLVFGGSVGSASAVVEWELVDDSAALGMNGVSPHVVQP